VFVALAVAISALLIVWMRRLRAGTQGLLACGLALIVGGALGNLIDRLLHGRVVDFILAHWGSHLFPAFNVADSAISIGAALVILDALLESRSARPQAGNG
jgi:signal peptidase II